MRRRTRLAVVASAAAMLAATAVPASAQDDEVVGVLQDLVRLNTSNPPGNEAAVAEYLRGKLEPLGFQVEIVPTPAEGKSHLIARLPATAPDGRKPLLLAGHADVVGVERPLWTVDPFEAVIKGDRLYGRGAMDFKGGLAAFTVAAMRLARENPPRTRDLILLSEADEEGGAYGTTWLAENFWPKIDAADSINEGGWIFAGGRSGAKLMGITTIDKNSLSVTFRTRGTSTHSSRPLPNSALRRLVRALDRVENYDTAPRVTPDRQDVPEGVGEGVGQEDRQAAAQAAERDEAGRAPPRRRPAAARALRRAVRRARAQHLRADDPGRRLPRERAPRHRGGDREHADAPGPEAAAADPRAQARGARPEGHDHADRDRRRDGGGDARLVRRARRRRSRRPPAPRSTARWSRRASASGRGVQVSPALFEAGTDAVPWRKKGIPVYGIYPYPISLADLQAMHGNDERVPIQGLKDGTDMLTRVIRAAVG